MQILHTILLILGVILLFNVMIFVHELGHFWAARWRGLYVDRFQIWFGQAIWKKTINGVQWGLGWIPAGGFVSLPQMAPMEAIEGDADLPKDLPPISAKDKIIVAFAGPLFSFLLALVFACIVWMVGKPDTQLTTTTIGYIPEGSPAASSGLLPGDKIVAIDGSPVHTWIGNMEGVRERIMLSEQPKINFTVLRPGETEPRTFASDYAIPETSWWQRKALRQVGILYASESIVGETLPDSPAAKAGLLPNDKIIAVDGKPIWSPFALMYMSESGKPLALEVKRGDETLNIDVTPALPTNADQIPDAKPMLGIAWAPGAEFEDKVEHPTPWEQIGRSLRWMKLTLEKVASSGSDVGVQHLAGPIGIATQFYNLLMIEDGWKLALWFAVVLNINLAILNLLPIPVVDGGHIVLGFAEWVRSRPVSGRVLDFVQTAFAIAIMGLFLFITSKDIGEFFGKGKRVPTPSFEATTPTTTTTPATNAAE